MAREAVDFHGAALRLRATQSRDAICSEEVLVHLRLRAFLTIVAPEIDVRTKWTCKKKQLDGRWKATESKMFNYVVTQCSEFVASKAATAQ